MQVKITNKEAVLKTKGKFCDEDINVVVDDNVLDERMDAVISGEVSGNVISNVAALKDYAFSYCKNLKTISLPNVMQIGGNAFRDCSSLIEFYAPKATGAGATVFSGCTALKTIELPIVKIWGYTFYGCTSLQSARFTNAHTILSAAFTNDYMLSDVYLGANQLIVLEEDTAFKYAGRDTANKYCTVHVRPEFASQYANETNWASSIAKGYIQIVGDYTD